MTLLRVMMIHCCLTLVRASGRLSVVGETLACDSGVARGGRGDTDVVVVP